MLSGSLLGIWQSREHSSTLKIELSSAETVTVEDTQVLLFCKHLNRQKRKSHKFVTVSYLHASRGYAIPSSDSQEAENQSVRLWFA